VSEGRINSVVGDPFDFRMSGARYSGDGNKIYKDDVIEVDP
jgi:hypothetical protein